MEKTLKNLQMERALKNHCREQYDNCKNYNYNIEKAIDRSYGAMIFCINNCFNDFNEDLAQWWDDKMLPAFRELQKEKNK